MISPLSPKTISCLALAGNKRTHYLAVRITLKEGINELYGSHNFTPYPVEKIGSV